MVDHIENNPGEPTQDMGNTIARPEGERYLTIHSVRIGVRPGYVLRKVGQAFMVMPVGPRRKDYQGMITLNETGAFLFKESQKPEANHETLVAACKSEYNATDEEAKQAVDMFVKQCAECGIFGYENVVIDVEEKRALTGDEIAALQRSINAKP